MRKPISTAFISAMLICTTATAQEQESWQEKLKRQLSNEDVSKAVGSIAGALLGTQVGSGRGKVLAVAAGALAGYWLGGKMSEKLSGRDKEGIAKATEQAVNTGQTTTWKNPDTGMATKVSVKDAPSGSNNDNSDKPYEIDEIPELEFVNSYYRPKTHTNVRGGPGTEYRVRHTLSDGTLVPVIGRVVDSNWVLISENGVGSGFVYAPLLELDADQSQAGNALRHSMAEGIQPDHYQIATQTCRDITQQVVLADGSSDSHTFRACQQPNGTWAEA